MKSLWRLTSVAFLVFAVVVGVAWWKASERDWAINQGRPLSIAPVVPAGAVPVLESATPLQTDGPGLFAKPVIAADPVHRIVVAQSLIGRESDLVQWRQVGDEPWFSPQTIPNFPQDTKFVGDPWIEGDRRGNYYLVHTSLPNGSLTFRRSNDFCGTWSPPRELARGIDRPVLGVSPNGQHLVIAASQGTLGPANPNAPQDWNGVRLNSTVTFTTVIWESHNFGRTWTRLTKPILPTHAIPFGVVVDDRGRIASSWISESLDGKGAVVSKMQAAMGMVTPQAGKPGVAATRLPSISFVCWTTEGGESIARLSLVNDLQPDRIHPFNGGRLPVLALSASGSLYVAYIDHRAGRLLIRTGDWNTWSEPAILSEEIGEEIRLPAVDALNSMVHVTWLARRNDKWQTYYRGSRDGGKTWSSQLLLSVPHASSKLIDKYGFNITSDDDQTSLRDDGAGTVHAVWTVKEPKSQPTGEVWHARIQWKNNEQKGGFAGD